MWDDLGQEPPLGFVAKLGRMEGTRREVELHKAVHPRGPGTTEVVTPACRRLKEVLVGASDRDRARIRAGVHIDEG